MRKKGKARATKSVRATNTCQKMGRDKCQVAKGGSMQQKIINQKKAQQAYNNHPGPLGYSSVSW